MEVPAPSGEKHFSGPSNKGRLTKNLYRKSQGLTLGWRVTWGWSERANLYSRHKNGTTGKDKKNVQHTRPWGPLPDGRARVICAAFPALSSAPRLRYTLKGKNSTFTKRGELRVNNQQRLWLCCLTMFPDYKIVQHQWQTDKCAAFME